MIVIIDYGMGNIHSVKKALESCGAKTEVTKKGEDIRIADKVVLPGVGAFKDAIEELKKQDLIEALFSHIKHKKKFLGICLGMQLLFESSQETKGQVGLRILKGVVKKFENKKDLKVPHMGWNQLKIPACSAGRKNACPLLKDIPNGSYVYFCHSYYPECKNKEIIATTTDYGIDFASIIWQDNIYGVQFHPEKSQEVGLRILKNFVDL